MNARVLLLVVVTGLFMTAWDGDQAAMQAAIAKRSQPAGSQVVLRRSERRLTGGHTRTHLLTVSADARKQQEPAAADSVVDGRGAMADEHPSLTVPLPHGITAGVYQAVNQTGRTVRVTVTEKQATGRNPRDFYMADSRGGNRWYLIRVLR